MEELIRRALGASVLSIEAVPAGHTVNEVRCCHLRDGRQVFFRTARASSHAFWGTQVAKYESEALALEHVGALGPRMVAHGVTDGRPWLAVEGVAGTSLRGLGELSAGLARRVMDEVVLRLCAQPVPFAHVGSFGGHGLMYDGPTPPGPCESWAQFVDWQLDWSASRAPEPVRTDLLQLRREGVCTRLLALHESRLVLRHGDLSLDNIFVGRADDAKLTLIDWEWSGVVDERDVWLEARELFRAMGAEYLWHQHVPFPAEALLIFEAVRNVAMGVAYSLVARSEEDRAEELEVLEDSVDRLWRLVDVHCRV